MTTERPSPFWKAYKIALNVYSLSFTLRLPFISFIYRFGSSSNEGKSHKLAYFGVDPLAEFASAVLHLDDPNMVLVLGTMPIFTVYIDYRLTFGREKGATTWRLLNDLVVVNRRQKLASRFKDSGVESGVENGVVQKQQQQPWWYKRWYQKVRSLWSAEEETATASKVETAFTTKLAAMFSSQTRSRLLVVSTVTELLFSSFFIFGGVLTAYVCLYYGHQSTVYFSGRCRTGAGPAVALELSAVGVICTVGNRNILFLVHCLVVGLTAINAHLQILKRQLPVPENSSNKNQSCRAASSWFSQAGGGQQWTAVDRFLAEGTALLCSLIRTNADVVSPLLFATLASNIGFNIYLTALLVYGRAPPFVSSLFLGAVLCNTVLALAPLVALFSAFHRVDYLCRLQMNISSSSSFVPLLRTKIKLMTYYEVLHTDDQFAFTVGPLGKVTTSAVFSSSSSTAPTL
ncbi:hypothetical protein TYRP_021193 [Tyrophagus putrescentiae]|nr:hypothetical protein TYRP_021193 [Tyrophagus putrescentiae]